MSKRVYFYIIVVICILNVSNFADDKAKTKADTAFVNVIDFKNGRFSLDIELAINYKDGKLNLFTRSKTVGDIFKEIEKKAKIEIKVDDETAQKKVSIFVSDKSLKEGIEAILNNIGQRDLAISYIDVGGGSKPAQFELSKVEIRKRNKEEMAKFEAEEEKQRKEEYARREKEYHDLFKDMGKKGKLEKMMKDYTEGKIDSNKLNKYLRQATIKPEEKQLLKVAILDPKFNNLKGALEMGLLHAIADEPEVSDKEFIIELMKNKETKGLLLYGMKFIWDEKFIPNLIGIVRDSTAESVTRSDAAGILGERKIKEAIPALEEALEDFAKKKENGTYILVALERITGLNYRVKNGKAEPTTNPPKYGTGIRIDSKESDQK